MPRAALFVSSPFPGLSPSAWVSDSRDHHVQRWGGGFVLCLGGDVIESVQG